MRLRTNRGRDKNSRLFGLKSRICSRKLAGAVETIRESISMIKNCKHFQICRRLTVNRPQIRLRSQMPTLLFRLNFFLLLFVISASAWGQFFESPPRVIDDANEDIVFSPNSDGVQDNLIISFVTNGFSGDYRIIIDVHGPGAVGRPDGKFDIDDDWVVKGKVGSGELDLIPPTFPKIIHEEWNGMDRSPSQEAPPNARLVGNGTYEVRVETDAFEDGVVDPSDFTYQSSTLTAVIDVYAPQISSFASPLFFSPNSDGIKDTTTITYTLSEHLSKLSLEFADNESQPAIKMFLITSGRQVFIWNGQDGLGTLLADGAYNLRLRGIDSGGNETTFDIGAVQIDTKAPTFSQVTPSQNAYLNTAVTAIVAEFNPAEQESPIDFDTSVTTVSLLDETGETLSGITRGDAANNRLTFTLDNPLDTISENGAYTAMIIGEDAAGNRVVTESNFNFDTVPPTLAQIRTDHDDFRPNGSVNTEITFVEVTLDDNIDGGLNLTASTIALNGPSGAIFGTQSFGGDNTLRWDLKLPLAKDGSEDGVYTITISAADRAENTANFGDIPFVYDTQSPRLISLTPNLETDSFHLGVGAVFRSQPLSRVVASFDDGEGSGVDLASTRIEILGSNAASGGVISLEGTRHLDTAAGTLALLLSQPLVNRDGTQDGAYSIRVTSADASGNTDTRQVDLIYDTVAPTIVSTAPTRNATVTTLSQVTLVLDDHTSGVDFANTAFRLVRDDIEIRAASSNNGRDTAVLTLSNPLAMDGSDDGEYTIEITTVDLAGNASDQIERRFFFVSQPPEIRLNAPAKEAANTLATIDAQLFNYIGAGIDFSAEESIVVVTRADGTVVPAASVDADEANNRLIWMTETPLPRDGSADGVYEVSVIYTDFVGQEYTRDFALTFDTQLPTVVQTIPAAGARVDRLETIAVRFAADVSGIDFPTTQLRLLDPNGEPVGTNRSDNGADTITLHVLDLQASATDGVYVIEVTHADRAGNAADSPYLSGFTYTSHEPLIALQPSDNLPTNQLNQISAALQDYVGPGINFDATETSISVRGTSGAVIAAYPIQFDKTELQLTWTAISPLPRDGSADGDYEVISRFVENLGLGAPAPTTFERISTLVFDTQPPRIVSTSPIQDGQITQLERVTVVLEDNLSGVDFDNTLVQLLDAADNPISTSVSNDGQKQITLTFDPFKTDGSADGVYRLEITPIDLAGNVSGLSTVEFAYAATGPDIEMLTPADGAFVSSVPEIRVLVLDRLGEGINFEKSIVSLMDANGANVAGILGNDGDRTLTLKVGWPTDGTADGEYTVNLNLVDNLGVAAAYSRQFTYDSVPPTIVAESRLPVDGGMNDNRIIVEIEVTDISTKGATESGVDFDATTIELQDSNGESVAGEKTNDGVKGITFTSAELASVGVYTLTVAVADRAGNVSVPQRFTYGVLINPPRVASMSPPAKSSVNRLTEISMVIGDESGTGIDFIATGATVELRSPDDAMLGGAVVDDGVDTVTLKLVEPLLTDGSDDGTYTVTVQPIDQRGVSGETREFTINYDTQTPRVQSVSHIDLTASVSNVNDSVRRIEAEIIDNVSEIDFERSSVQLWRHTEEGRVLVPGALDNDGALLWWQLEVPLASSGADDGLYSVEIKAVDNAGNVEEKAFRFLYGTQAPVISSISPPAKSRLNRLTEISAVIEDESGAGIDFSTTGSTIELRSPDDAVVGGAVVNNGIDTLTLKLVDSLLTDGSDDGVYLISVQPVDLRGISGEVWQFRITYDTQSPRVQSVSHIDLTANISNVNDSVRRIEAEIIDDGSGVDFEGSNVQLWRHSGDERVLVPGTLDNNGVLLWRQLEAPLAHSGADDGTYSVEVMAVDAAGNVEHKEYKLLYDTQAPAVNAIQASAVAGDTLELDTGSAPSVVEAPIHQIHVVFSDGLGSGIDVSQTTIQLVRSDDAAIGATLQDNGAGQISLTFDPFKTDGSVDGVYRLEISPVDLAGNVGGLSIVEFVYAAHGPDIEMLTPADGAFVNRVPEIRALVLVRSGGGIDFERSIVSLMDANGANVDGILGNDGDRTLTLKLGLPTDGTADGEYTVNLNLVDNLGVEAVYTRRFTYDSVPPAIVTASRLPVDDGINDNRLLAEIEVTDDSVAAGSGVDFDATTVELQDSNGEPVAGEKTNDGERLMTFTSAELTRVGVYTLTVAVADRAGNVSVPQRFTYGVLINPPRVALMSPPAKSSVNRLTEISMVIGDESGTGIDFIATGATVELRSPDDAMLGGTIVNDGVDTVMLKLVEPLLTDGSDDGTYTVTVQPIDQRGVSGETREFTINYDTQTPRVQSVSQMDMTASVSNVNDSVRRIEAEIIDDVSEIDFERSSVQLWRHTEEGRVLVPGALDNDGVLLWWQLEVPLASSGADDGLYSVEIKAVDNAGNVEEKAFRFLYGTQAPVISSISPPAKSRLNRLTEISAVIEDESGAGIDFSTTGSTIELRSPDDAVVGGAVVNNGIDTLTLKLVDSLLTDGSDDGVYLISVQPVDLRGISGEVWQFRITYDTQSPRVQSVSHIDLTANISNVNDPVRRIEAEIIDNGSGIDFEGSYVRLWRDMEDGRVLVPGTPDNDGSLLWWQLEVPLAHSGADDGTYSVEVKAVDAAGNVEHKEYGLLYDTQAPAVSAIQASAVAGDTLELDTGSAPSVVEAPIHQIHVVFSDGSGSGVDVSQTTVQLIDADGMAIAATQQHDGLKTVSIRFNPLRDGGADDGRYLIQVTPIDRAGNTFASPVEFQFFYATRKPEILSTTPAEFASVNILDSVSAVLQDHSGEGIDFDRSTIGLHNSEGNLIGGRQRKDEEASVIAWELNQPLSRNGVDDGEYSIRLVAFSSVGSELESSKTFLYDTRLPQVVSVSADTTPSTFIPANELVVFNQSFARMTVTLSDDRTDLPDEEKIPTSGIDFAGTTVRLIGPDEVQKGITVNDDGATQLIISFAPLIQPGAYTLEITPRDFAGNESGHPLQYNFSLDLVKPRVNSVTIGKHTAPVAFVNQLDRITAKLVDPNGVGLDLTTGGSTVSVTGPSGVVDGLQEGNGVDALTWLPLHLPEDGTVDGRYTVTVTPIDNLGLSGAPARYRFVLDTQKPELISAAPINLTQAMSYIGEQIIQISAQVADVGPAGLDISTQTIQLQDSNGFPTSADLTSDGDSQIFLTLAQPLATNGSDDGEYAVIIRLADRAGNTLEIEHTFIYDTQAPTLVNTDPAGDLIRDDLTLITADLSERGGSGIDFEASQLTLFDPSGNQVNGKLGNDGVGQLVLQLDELAEDGSYRIRVLAVDRAGNGASAPFDRTFLFSTNLPTVVSTVPVTAPAESAFTRTPPNQIEVEFQSSPNLSTVKLTHPNGTTVPGQQIRDGNRLIYRLSRELATDGSDDGSYTILVTPVNSAGRGGEQQQYTFIYDTVPPVVEGALPVVKSPGVNNALSEILAIVTDADPSSSVDWDKLDDSWMTLEKIGTEKMIRGRVSTDKDEIIRFRLESPLASDGSQDGKYRVTVIPIDRAGNIAVPSVLEFVLDTRPPVIHTDSLSINDRPLFVDTNHPDYPSADGSGSGVAIRARMSDLGFDGEGGLGVDLSQSSIVVTAPDGETVAGNLIQNGTDTIIFRSGPLIAQGFYQVEITSVGLDVDGLGFAPSDSITTQFLHETTAPVAELTDFGGKTNLTDQPLPLRGTATDPVSETEQDGSIQASGIAFVEIVGAGPDGEPIEPVLAVDNSGVESEAWSSWSLDFLPARSGGYNLAIRVTDRAGNVAVYDGVNVNLSVSLTYRGSTYSWPSPLKRSTGDRAHFSFDVNIPQGSKINMILSVYDFAGDLVFEKAFPNISPGRDSDQLVTWDLKNQAGAAVARGVYIFRLEAEDVVTKTRSNAVGKMLVIE